MDRRSFFPAAAAAGLLVVRSWANAAELPRVAIVFMNAPVADIADYRYFKAFARGLREQGMEEGRNIFIVRRSAEGRYDQLPQLMQEVVAASPDVIVTIGPGVMAAQHASRTIPIIAVQTDGLVELGAVASLRRPGGNVTGLTGEVGVAEMCTKRLQLLHEVAPRASRVAVLGYSLRAVASRDSTVESAARAFGQTIVWVHARTTQDLKTAFATIEKEQIDALYVESAPVTYRHLRDIVDLAVKLKLPSICESREGPELGGLMSYGANLEELFSRAASFVDKVLEGAKPGDLPMEQPAKFELVLNRVAAKTLGINFPPTLLQRADAIVG